MVRNILLVQATVVTLLSTLFVIFPSVQAVYQILSQLTVILYLIMYILMFAAAIYLRYSQPDCPRSYRIPGGGKVGMLIIGGASMIGSIIAFLFSFIPPGQISVGSPTLYVKILVGATIFFVIIPFLLFRARKPEWRDKDSDFAPFTWEVAAAGAKKTSDDKNTSANI